MYQSSPPPLPFPGEAAQAPVYPYAYHQQPQPYASTSSQPYPYYAPAQAAYDPYAVPATPQYQYQQPGSARPLPQPGNRPLPQPSSARALPQPPTKQRSLPTVPQRYSPAVDPRYQYTNQPSQALNQAPIIDSSSRPASYGAAVASLNHSPSIPQHHAGPGPPIPPPRQEPTRTESAPIPPIRHDSVTSIRNDTPAQSNGSPALSGAGSEFGSQTDSPVQSISSRTASIRSVDSFGGVKGTDSLGRRKQWTSWDRGASRKPVLENDIADLKLQDGPQTESQAVPIAPKRQESAPARYGAPIANAATPSKPDMPSFSINEESSSTATIPSFTVSEEPNKPDIPTFSISVEESAKHDIPIFSISEDKPDLPTFSISEESKPDVPTFSFSADDDPPPTGPSISFSVAPPTPKEQSTSEYFPKVLDPSPSTQATPSPAQPTVPAQPTTTSLSNDMLCGGCNLPIAGKVVSAMKRRWHPDCFTCTHCATSLEHVAFYEHDGRPYCHFDYHEKFSIRCYHCKTPIVDETYITLSDPQLGSRTYHDLHFFCSHCGDPFIDPKSLNTQTQAKPFVVHEGYAYCEDCNVRMNKPKCFSCKKSIMEDVLRAMGRIWHEDCFVCSMCEKPFEDPEFFTREDLPYCEECYRIKLRSDL